MAVLSETSSVTYTGNAVATSFAIPFPFYLDTEITVRQDGVELGLDSDFTISGHTVGEVSGSVVITPALADGVELVIERNVPYTQTADLITQGTHSPATIEERLDEGVFQCQQLDRRVSALEAEGVGGGGGDPVTLAAVGSTPNAAAASLSGQELQFQPASSTYPGVMSAADKAKLDGITGTHTGDNSGNVSLAAFGAAPNANGASLAGQVLTLQPASSSHPGGLSTAAQQIMGKKSFLSPLVSSGRQLAYSESTGDVTANDSNEVVVVDASGGAATVTLPLASTMPGGRLTVKRINAGANNVTIDANGSQTIDGALTKVLTFQWQCVTLLSVSSGWVVIADSHAPVTLAAVGSSPNANGAVLTAQALALQVASAAFPGVMSAADKSKLDGIGTLSGSNTGDVTLGAFGSTANANGASLAAQVLTLQPASASHPGGVSTGTQVFAGKKTISDLVTGGRTQGVTNFTSSLPSTIALTLDATHDLVFVDASATDALINLPSSASNPGRRYTIRRKDSSTTNFVLVVSDGSDTINGSTSSFELWQWESMTLASDGLGGWQMVVNNVEATATMAGLVSTSAQEWSGQKQFDDGVAFDGSGSESGATPEVEYKYYTIGKFLADHQGFSGSPETRIRVTHYSLWLVYSQNCYYDANVIDAIPVGFKSDSAGVCYLWGFNPSTGWRTFTYTASGANEKFLPDFNSTTYEQYWKAFSYSNNWADASGTLGNAPAAYRLSPDRSRVELRGAIRRTSGTAVSGETAITLPTGYRPVGKVVGLIVSGGTGIIYDISTAGVLKLYEAPSVITESEVILDGIWFPVS